MEVPETVRCQLSQLQVAGESLYEQGSGYGYGHEEQDGSEYGIELADDLVHREQGCHYVVREYDVEPDALVPAGEGVQQVCRAGDERDSDGNQYEGREDNEKLPDARTEVFADHVRQAHAVIAYRQHT